MNVQRAGRALAKRIVLAFAVAAPAFAFGATPPPPRHMPYARTTWDSVFSTEQAARGESTYTRTCARCHRAALAGADEAPALAGGAFMSGWNGQSLYDLHDRIRTTMPSDTPGTYSRKDIADVIAYVLSFNGFPAGKGELPVSDDSLREIRFVSVKP